MDKPLQAKSIFGSAAGHIGAFLVVSIWGTTFVSSKVLLNAGLMPADIFFARFLIAYICILSVSHKKMIADSLGDELTMAGLGLMGGSLYFLTENMALVYSTSSNVSILVSSTPLLTAIVVSIFYKSERLTRRQVLGSIVAFIGGVLVVLNGQLVLHMNPAGDTLALSAALMWAFYSLLMRRVMDRYSTDFITRKVFFYGIITIIPYFFIFHPLDVNPEIWCQPVVIGNVLFLGLIASSGCYLLWNWVMREVGAVHSTNYIYLQSLITMLFGAIILHERITLMGLSGAVILILGMVGALMRRK